MKQHSVTAALGLLSVLIAAPVFAQSNTPTTKSASPASSAAASGWMTHPDANQWLVSHLKGMAVYNGQNEKLGSIDELLMDQSGKVQGAVLDVGGFLGMGVHRVAIPFDQLTFVNTRVNQTPTTANNASGNRPLAPANAPATAANTANAPGNPSSANTGSAALGSNPAATDVTRTTTTGNTVSTASTTGSGPARNDNVPDHATLNATSDQLKSAPEFKFNS